MRINHNLSALNAWKNMSVNDTGQNKSLEKLSSGLRIGRAADDAAGLSISEKMRGQISGLNQASRNAQDGISLLQTAEGALQETHSILQRMRELAVQSASDTVTDADRGEIQKEINALRVEIDRIATDTEFNTQKLLDGKFTNKTIHIGANSKQNLKLGIDDMGAFKLKVGVFTDFGEDAEPTKITDQVKVYGQYDPATEGYENAVQARIEKVAVEGETPSEKLQVVLLGRDGEVVGDAVDAATEGSAVTVAGVSITVDSGVDLDSWTDVVIDIYAGIDVSTQTNADAAITTINDAINTVSGERSKLGAIQNRLEHTIANLSTSVENLTAAESRIRDVDIAVEMMEFTKYQILSQASTAMLAQANAKPQAVLQLLR